ncbi:hypothetical protein BDD12DRAFT_110530 [Trichophaea hybrida]|nr:hypothetical protein BDD12DRAFT_110530 [Trichophaea hybrida]
MPPHADTRESLALSVLSRYLPTLTRIIATTSFCHLYRGVFTAETGEFTWEKKDLAGSSFLCASTSSPSTEEQYHLIILNRLGVTNFIWTLSSTECIEDDGNHLVFNHTSGYSPIPAEPGYEIDEKSCWGIWVFPNPSMVDEREKMRESLMECARLAEETTKAKERLQQQQQQQQQQAPPPAPPITSSTPEYEHNGGAPLGGFSIMNQVFGPQASAGTSPHYSTPPPQQHPPVQQQQQQQQQQYTPGPNGNDILGRLFENARQWGPHVGY